MTSTPTSPVYVMAPNLTLPSLSPITPPVQSPSVGIVDRSFHFQQIGSMTPIASSPASTSTTSHRQWSSNICDCCVEPQVCCKAFCCPCLGFKTISNQALGEESTCCKGSCRCICCCLMPCSVFLRAPYRKKLRVKYNLPAKPCNDCCTAFWCPSCAIAQELREINYQTSQTSPPHRATMV